jgi:hypothetical protein
MLPPVLVILDNEGKISEIHHMEPLFVFPRTFVSTRWANSKLDPNNQSTLNLISVPRRAIPTIFAKSPTGIPSPGPPLHHVAASVTGNVNSTIVYNYMTGHVIPWMRSKGVTKKHNVIVNTDLHASHASQRLINTFQQENITGTYFPADSTHLLQLQDAEKGQFNVLKRYSKRDIDAWNAFFIRRGQQMAVEDFPFVVQNSYRQSIEPKVTELALKTVGLFPFNPDKVLHNMPGTTTYAQYKQKFEAKEKEAKEADDLKGDTGAVTPTEDLPVNANFFRTASNPEHNRSPKRKNGPRLVEHVNKVTFDARFDVFDFDKQERQKKIVALVHEQTLTHSNKTGERGRRVGKEGDVFLCSDITEKRDQVKKLKANKLKQKNMTKLKKAERLKRLQDELKTAKIELKKKTKAHRKTNDELKIVKAELRKENKAHQKTKDELNKMKAKMDNKKQPQPQKPKKRGRGTTKHANKRSLRRKTKVNYPEIYSDEEEEEKGGE